MSVIIGGASKVYHYINEELADEKTRDWFLMRSPWLGLSLLGVYLLLVLKCLPSFMKNRPAYDLRGIITFYNIFQIIGCTYVVYQSLVLGWLHHYSLMCQPVEDGEVGVKFAWRVCYSYFLMKLLDLFDTIFFALRKKQNQITFLHVYHHCGVVALAWGIVKWYPGGHISLLVTLNSFVHIIMYGYYLLALLDNKYKKSIWWKKYVTQIQLIQFGVLLIHFTLLLFIKDCSISRVPSYVLIPQHLYMFLLFGDFYYRAYIKSPKKEAVANGKH